MTVKKYIYVTFQKEGIHCYPDAPDEVAFLRSPHRHKFYFKVRLSVHHSNREREFFIEKRWMENLYDESTLELNHLSCEMMAEQLYDKLKVRYKGENREIHIDISEDNENGCYLIFDPANDADE